MFTRGILITLEALIYMHGGTCSLLEGGIILQACVVPPHPLEHSPYPPTLHVKFERCTQQGVSLQICSAWCVGSPRDQLHNDTMTEQPGLFHCSEVKAIVSKEV